ncbi:MAG: VanW family protein [Actinobacteria bacterium]|nr:VanW family protein [Actinomycetota bacterium]
MYAEAGSRAVHLRRRKAARRRLVLQWSLVGVATLSLGAGGLGFLFAGSPQRLPAGATVAGVAVGSLTIGEAVQRLERRYERLRRVPVTFTAGPRRFTVRPNEIVREVNWRSAVETARRQGDGIAPVRGLRRLGTRFFGADITPPTTVSDELLTHRLSEIARRIDRPERHAAIRLVGLTPKVVPGATGRTLVRDASARIIVRSLVTLSRSPAALPVQITRPKVTAVSLSPAATQVATAVSGPVRLALGETRWRLPRWRIAKMLDLPDKGATTLALGGAEADAYFARFRRRVDRAPSDAEFVVAGDAVSIRPAAPGLRLDVAAARTAILAAALSETDRTARLVAERAQPERSTREARAMGITGLVGGYTTYYGGDPNRIHNVQLVSRLVDGALIAPGSTFSFNATTGERSEERGFREAPVIINGELQSGIGGGVCQVSTTVFNAAFEAGLSIESRTNHALYISHYPQGRDATVNYPDLDLKFLNDTDKWLLLRAFVGSSALTVKLFGTPVNRRVETETGPLEVTGPPTEKNVPDPAMWVGEKVVEDDGEPSRKTSATRRVYTESGKLLYDTTWASSYRAEPKVIRYGTKPRPEAPPPPPPPKKKDPQPPPPPPPPVQRQPTTPPPRP